jgi:hypothetical protein
MLQFHCSHASSSQRHLQSGKAIAVCVQACGGRGHQRRFNSCTLTAATLALHVGLWGGLHDERASRGHNNAPGSQHWGLGVVWVLGFGFWVLGFGFWVLGFGFWVLGFGIWVLGFGFWLSPLDFCFSDCNQSNSSRVQADVLCRMLRSCLPHVTQLLQITELGNVTAKAEEAALCVGGGGGGGMRQ